jgi:DNA-binding LytR/AlgR family response regulator
MYKIAIIEDNKEELSNLLKQIEKYQEEKNVIFDVKTFENAYYFIHDYKNDFHIVFMDIDLPGVNGMDTAKKLRELDHNVSLVFVTNLAQYAIKGYEVDALDFIIKPATMESITYVLDKAMKRLSASSSATFSLKTARGTISLSENEISYVEVFDHNLVYHTTKGEFTVRGKLSDLTDKLDPERFVMCNRSFIVNLRYVSNVTADYLSVGDTRITISKSHRKELMQRFSSFLGDSL